MQGQEHRRTPLQTRKHAPSALSPRRGAAGGRRGKRAGSRDQKSFLRRTLVPSSARVAKACINWTRRQPALRRCYPRPSRARPGSPVKPRPGTVRSTGRTDACTSATPHTPHRQWTRRDLEPARSLPIPDLGCPRPADAMTVSLLGRAARRSPLAGPRRGLRLPDLVRAPGRSTRASIAGSSSPRRVELDPFPFESGAGLTALVHDDDVRIRDVVVDERPEPAEPNRVL